MTDNVKLSDLGTDDGRPVPRELGPELTDERARAQLAAIVEGSDDAILTKDLNGIIRSWNRGAQNLFGYTADEAIGRPVTILIPLERHDEERDILGRIRRGERVHHYETVRRCKDGRLVDISLTVSPIRDATGQIVGASKVARDISEWRRAQEQQHLLLKEMQHRVKNIFALAGSLITLSAPRAKTPKELADMTRARLNALARAHTLTVSDPDRYGQNSDQPTTLHALLKVLATPTTGDEDSRLTLVGTDVPISPRAVTPLALVLNELFTNATKHGALFQPGGAVTVETSVADGVVQLVWSETGCAPPPKPIENGFGTRLSEITAQGQLGGSIRRDWTAEGLMVLLTIDAARI